jgi:hypothetical protein
MGEDDNRIKVIQIDFLGDAGELIETITYDVDALPDLNEQVEFIIEEYYYGHNV